MKTSLLNTLLATLMLLAVVCPAAQAARLSAKSTSCKSSDSITVRKQSYSRTHKFSIYTDADQKAIFFFVKGEAGRIYQLFVFDVDGKLVKQTEIRNKQTTVLKAMERGDYMFDVFSDDLKIGNGQLTIR